MQCSPRGRKSWHILQHGEPWSHDANQNEPGTKGQMLHGSTKVVVRPAFQGQEDALAGPPFSSAVEPNPPAELDMHPNRCSVGHCWPPRPLAYLVLGDQLFLSFFQENSSSLETISKAISKDDLSGPETRGLGGLGTCIKGRDGSFGLAQLCGSQYFPEWPPGSPFNGWWFSIESFPLLANFIHPFTYFPKRELA